MTSSQPSGTDHDPYGGLAGREARAVLLAIIGWIGADFAPPWLGAPVVGVATFIVALAALAARNWLWLAVGVFFLLSNLGASAAANYEPVLAGSFDGSVAVVDDPRPVGAGWAVVVRLPTGERVEAIGYGPTGWGLAEVAIGETYRMAGRLRAPGEGDWLRVRHITGRLSVHEVGLIGEPGPHWVVPETLRGLVFDGASTMSDRQRALYLGLVVGDDRFQPLGQRLRFRASGLTHLLAVSGQNVAFVLAVLGGPLRLFGRRWRLIVTIAALVVFAMMTRLEPSVLRATASALLAVWASTTGRERSGLMILSVAVLGLLCVDPFLVDSIGFQLSVAASAGILVLQPILQRRIPGPSWLTGPLATTIAAQLGVSPILGLYFGPVSLASVPANLLAGWAAGAVMTVGMSVGIVAGLTPPSLRGVLHLPTIALLSWIESVAAWHANTSAPRLGPASAIGLSALALAVLPARAGAGRSEGQQQRHRRRLVGWLFVLFPGFLVGALLVGAVPRTPTSATSCGNGVTWYPAGERSRSVLVIAAGASARSIEGCMDAGIGAADVLVSMDGGRRAADLVTAAREVMEIPAVMAPPQHRIVGARRQLAPVLVRTGSADLTVTPSSDGRKLLVVEELSLSRQEPQDALTGHKSHESRPVWSGLATRVSIPD